MSKDKKKLNVKSLADKQLRKRRAFMTKCLAQGHVPVLSAAEIKQRNQAQYDFVAEQRPHR
jgi:hypothetical protein